MKLKYYPIRVLTLIYVTTITIGYIFKLVSCTSLISLSLGFSLPFTFIWFNVGFYIFCYLVLRFLLRGLYLVLRATTLRYEKFNAW